MNTDILQEANFEILSAASDYDYKNAPYPFSIYAAFRIHRAFLSAISDFTELMHGSEVIREKCNDIARERKRLQDSGDSDPDISQIASAAGCNVEFAHAVLSQIAESEGRDQKPLSQYEQDSEAKNAPEPEAAVQKLLDKLNDTERRVISLRYGLSGKPLSADETAAKLSLTADEVEEIEQNALIHLRTL